MTKYLLLIWLAASTAFQGAEPLHVCASVPDLGEIAKAVGGDDVTVTIFARGGDDPHFIDARPSFAKALSRADLLMVVGLELEVGWIPTISIQSRNPRIAPGQPGYFDAAMLVPKLGVPDECVDRSRGDVHAGGNPHFLTDPVYGVMVAKNLARRLGELQPDKQEAFTARYRTFAQTIGTALVGESTMKTHGLDRVIFAMETDQLDILRGPELGGWLQATAQLVGKAVFADHDLWPYVAHRFGFTVVGFLEPKPGVPPTSGHLADLITLTKTRPVAGIITVPYFDPRHARFMHENAGLPVVILAHQVGATPDADGYVAMIDRNVRALVTGLTVAP